MPKLSDSIGYLEDTLVVDKSTLVFKDSTGAVIDKAAVVAKLNDSKDSTLPEAIIVDIEATHSGITKNNTEYDSDHMEKSAKSWTSPYNKPVLKEHNPSGPTLGRVRSYEFKQSALNPEKDTIQLSLEITDKDSIRRHMDGTALTYSIGGQAKEVYCSICGIDILNSDHFCGHWKGDTYEKQDANGNKVKEKCIWKIGTVDYLEVSEVNIPADEWAQKLNVSVKPKDSTDTDEGAEGAEGAGDQSDGAKPNVADGLGAADNILDAASKANDTDNKDKDAGDKGDPGNTGDNTNPDGDPNPATTTDNAKTPEQYEAEIKALNDKITVLEANLLTESNKVAALETKVTSAETAKALAESKVAEVQASSQQTFKASVEVAKQLKRVYADSIVDAKIRVGELTEDKRKDETDSLVVKSAKELSDTLDGLKVAEKARKPLPHVTQADVGAEGALSVHQDNVDVDPAKEQAKQSKPFTAADAVDAIVNKQ